MVFFHPTYCLHTHTQLHKYRCLMRPACCAALSSGYALTEYTSSRAWNRARLVSSILGHKRSLCRRTAGPFKTGLSLIGHTSVAPSRQLASQLIREAEQSRSLRSQSALNLLYSKQDVFLHEADCLCFTTDNGRGRFVCVCVCVCVGGC